MKTIKLDVELTYWDNGQLEREVYKLNGKLHNPHGPAFRSWDGSHGKLDAEIYSLNGNELTKEEFENRDKYYVNGKFLTKEEKEDWEKKINSCNINGKKILIDGKEYELREL